MAKPELYRAKCGFSPYALSPADKATQDVQHKSVPTSPNFLRSANINALNLNNKVNQNIQFFTKLSAKTIEEGGNAAVVPGSPKAVLRKKDKSPGRLADKENDQQGKKEEDPEDQEGQEGEREKKDEKPSEKQERVKVLLDLPNQEQKTSKSTEDLSEVGDDVNEKDLDDIKDLNDLKELFLGFKEGDLFRVLSKEWELWWAVRSLDSNRRVGLVQAQLLEKTEDDAHVLDDEEAEDMDQIETNLKASLDELRQRIGENDPAGIYSEAMIPEAERMERCNQRNQPGGLMGGMGLGGLGRPMPTGGPPHVSSEGLILPRKPQNPCLDSTEKQNLHRELMFNQKMGKSPLNQKSELQRALQTRKEHQVRKEAELQKQQSKTPFEQMIEARARKLESKPEEKNNLGAEPEFIKVHAKLRAKMEPK
ncbi:uncharacterized protein LOC117652182 [Thrips palmi]|uniref:Uncharacterized protein LOC117652182 n=1 Tax=Thrips palmi TaxID=161013 RepID=A0A6P9A4F1_THRPL|nr:uncharacterized protein LOC117652182 [Thrips palmi]